MKNDLENEVNERKNKKKLQYHYGIEPTTYSLTLYFPSERLTTELCCQSLGAV